MALQNNPYLAAFVLLVFAFAGCEDPIDYKNYPDDVGEIVLKRCATAGCHNDRSKDAAAGLSMESWDKLFEGGRNNVAVVPYRPDQSMMMFYINTDSMIGPALEPTMPYNQAALSVDQVSIIRNWIAQGAPDRNGFVRFSDNPQRAKVYVANQGCDLVAVLDLESKLIMRYIDVGATASTEAPHNIRVSPDGEYWYVCFTAGSVLQKFRTSDDSYVDEATLGFGKWNTFAITSDSKKAFVVDWSIEGSIAYVDLESMTMLQKYQGSGLFSSPHGSVLKNDSTLYVTSQSGNFIYKIDVSDPSAPESTQIALETGGTPGSVPDFGAHEISFSPDKSEYVVTCQTRDEIRFFSASNDSLIAVVSTGVYPQEISFSKTTDYLFISCTEDDATFPGEIGSIAIINYRTHTLLKSIFPGFQPHGIEVDDESMQVFVSNRNANPNGPAPHHTTGCEGRNGYLTVIDLNTLELIPDYRTELSVDPYFLTVRR